MGKTKQLIHEVVKGTWTAKQLQCIALLAELKNKQQNEIAGILKINPATISKWKQLSGFMADVQRVADHFFIEYDMQVDKATLRDALRDITEHPDVASSIIKSRELYLKRRGLLVDKIVSKNETVIEHKLSDDMNEEQSKLIAKSILANGGEGK